MTSENEQPKPTDASAIYGDAVIKGADEPEAGDDAMESLIAGSRVTTESVMDDQLRLSDEQREQIRARWQTFRDAQEDRPQKGRINNKRLAREIAEKESTLSQVLADKYPRSKDGGTDRIDQVLRKVDQFISKYEKIEQSRDRGVFAWTEVAKRIAVLVELTAMGEGESIGACCGSAGIGKTKTMEYLLTQHPGSFLVTIADKADDRTVRQLMKDIAKALGISTRWSTSDTRDRIVDILKGSHRLCMVDEAHLATPRQLNALRQLHDECRMPLFLMGMPALQSILMRGRGDDSIGATLYSRVQVFYDLEQHIREGGRGKPLYSMADIRKVFSESRLRIDPEAIRWLQETANDPDEGGLRCARAVFRVADHLAHRPGSDATSITCELLEQAAEFNPRLRGLRARRRVRDNGEAVERAVV